MNLARRKPYEFQEEHGGRSSPAIASVNNGRLALTKAQRQSLTDSYIVAQ